MTNREKIKEIFPNIILIGTVMMYKPTEQVLASGINYNWLNSEYKEPTPTNDLGVDCISRQAVIEITAETGALETQDRVKALPSVTPQEPRKGHWIYDYTSADGHKTYHCSECGCYLQPRHSESLNSFKWCSLCGADMREMPERKALRPIEGNNDSYNCENWIP